MDKETSQYFKGTCTSLLLSMDYIKEETGLSLLLLPLTEEEEKLRWTVTLPMFNALAIGAITKSTQGKLNPSMYDLNTAMDGKQYIYGVQLGLTYKINDWLSAFIGRAV